MPVKVIYPGVYVEEVPSGVHAIQGVAASVAVFVGPARRGSVNRPVRVRSFQDFERKFGGLAPRLETGFAVWQYFLNGGQDAWVVRVAINPSLRQLQAGLKALATVDLFNLLVLPGMTSPAAIELAAGFCHQRRAFLIVDAPAAQSPAQMEQAVVALGGDAMSNAAVYYPWIRIADPSNGAQSRLTPPSGTVAGLFARTDSTRGVWKAPAGVDATLHGVDGLEYNLSDPENGQLNPIAINCLRKFPVDGIVVWGARTLRGADSFADEYKYIPVRRTALFIEESLFRGTRWAVFEPNAEPLWAQLRLNIGAFMHDLFRQGAFQGSAPKDAYFVKCDQETNTANDIGAGVVNILVGFAPLKPAEFIIIKLQQLAGQVAS